MESFTIFQDLPSIEEPDQVMGDHIHQHGNWYNQNPFVLRSFNGYESEAIVPVDGRRLPYTSPLGYNNMPYSGMHWPAQYQRGIQWLPSYEPQAIKAENSPSWPTPALSPGHFSNHSSFSDHRSLSDDGSNRSWCPASPRDDYPTTPDENKESWRYQPEVYGAYSQGAVYASPTCSHASIMSKSEALRGIKLEDVQGGPDAYPADQFSQFEKPQRVYTFEHSEYSQAITGASPREGNSELTPPQTPIEDDVVLEDAATDCGEDDNASDYNPKPRSRTTSSAQKTGRSPKNTGRTRPKMKTRSRPSRVSKRTPTKEAAAAEVMIALSSGKNVCPHCAQTCNNKSALNKHITTAHTRPFTCTFRKYGCTGTFGSKNEWKRHVSSQHLRLGIWRCDIGVCYPQMHGHDDEELIFNDFNRKDLFTQHLRRMHGPPSSCSTEEKATFTATLDTITARCLRDIRSPPPRSTCGFCAAEGVSMIFEGPGAWETRMEHVGRHLESGHADEREWVEDIELREWMQEEHLLEGDEHTGYWLTGPAYVNASRSK